MRALLLALASARPAAAADPPGEVIAVAGVVSAQAAAASRPLQRGDAIFAGERITTGERAHVDIRFSDGGRLQLGPESEFELAEYRFAESAGAFAARISRGVFRLVSGLIALRNRDDYRAQLPTVTIGVRGTDFAGEIEGETARIVLLAPETGAATAIEVWNDFGRVIIDEPGYGTEIADAGSPPSPPRRMRLQGVGNMLRSMNQAQRLQMPRPLPRPQ